MVMFKFLAVTFVLALAFYKAESKYLPRLRGMVMEKSFDQASGETNFLSHSWFVCKGCWAMLETVTFSIRFQYSTIACDFLDFSCNVFTFVHSFMVIHGLYLM